MPAICEEEWEVSTGKETFTLNPDQVALLKVATTAGETGLVWFKDFAVSIPHIISISLKRREYFEIAGNIKRKIGKTEFEGSQKKLK